MEPRRIMMEISTNTSMKTNKRIKDKISYYFVSYKKKIVNFQILSLLLRDTFIYVYLKREQFSKF